MAQWTVCPACGLRHSRGPDHCPRCSLHTAGSDARSVLPTTATSASGSAAAGATARRPSRSLGLGAVLGMVGMVLLLSVVSVVARRAGRAAVLNVHWRDPVLLKAEENLGRDLQSLLTMERSLEAFRATALEDARALGERAAVLEIAASRLEGVGAAAGLTLEERHPARKTGGWTTSSVRVRAGRHPSELIDALGRLSVPEGTWVEAARCTGTGCSLVLSAATWREPQRPPGLVLPRSLPPRPWWPPSAEVWDRVQQAGEENARHRAVVDELHALKMVREKGTLLELVTVGGRSERHRAAFVGAIGAALAAGMSEVEVVRAEGGVFVTVPQRSPGFSARLTDLGTAYEERTSGAGTTYVLAFGRGRVRAASYNTDLPAGFSAGF